MSAALKTQIMSELKGSFVTESELRHETLTLGNDLFAQIRGITKRMDELTKIINRPNDYTSREDVATMLRNYTTKEDVEDLILLQRIDSKAPK